MAHRFSTNGRLDRDALMPELRAFLETLIRTMRLDVRFEVRAAEPDPHDVESPEVEVNFRGRDQELLVERGAELLRAIEYIALRAMHIDPKLLDHVRFECGDFVAMRIEELKLSAKVAAERVLESRQPFAFNAMSARERRIIHLALKDTPGVRTTSEGDGDRRHVVLYPAG